MNEKNSQETIWNKIAELWSNFRKRTPSEVETFLKEKKGKILDLGCGSGRNLLPEENLEYYGVDFSEEMLKIAEKDAESKKIRAVFIKADIGKEKLPLPSNFFDQAIFISTLHCIPTEKERLFALKELYRVMKKNARVMITVWRKEAIVQDKQASEGKEIFVNWKKDGTNYERYYYFYNEKELENILKKVGFKILREKNADSFLSRKNIVFYLEK